MTDLLTVLPDFDPAPFSHIVPSLERARISAADLLASNALDTAKRAQLPVREVQRLYSALVKALHADLGFNDVPAAEEPQEIGLRLDGNTSQSHDNLSVAASGRQKSLEWKCISTLDAELDEALGGGIPCGYLTEITGESGTGKTHLLLTLLLSAQLLPLATMESSAQRASAIYIATESSLPTSRLAQILGSHPRLCGLSSPEKPELDRILTLQTPDLESQEHIFRYQLPLAVRHYRATIVVVDSITANFRAEFERSTSTPQSGPGGTRQPYSESMARRAAMLAETAALLRGLARNEGVAVVVTNQVADRFVRDSHALDTPAVRRYTGTLAGQSMSSSPLVPSQTQSRAATMPGFAFGPQAQSQPLRSSPTPGAGIQSSPPLAPTNAARNPNTAQAVSEVARGSGSGFDSSQSPSSDSDDASIQAFDPLVLDHQQRFFTGWGDLLPQSASAAPRQDDDPGMPPLKTPSLGLTWANQLSARIALTKRRKLRPWRAGARDTMDDDDDDLDESSSADPRAVQDARNWERRLRVVWAVWCADMVGKQGVGICIGDHGLRSLKDLG